MNDLFGISGLTVGGAGIWLAIIAYIGRIAIRWVMGIPDRKRADIAGADSEEAAIAAQWERFQKEIDRLLGRITQLENRVEHLEGELNESREREVAAVGRELAAVADLTKLRAVNDGQGQMRQDAAAIVAADRQEGKRSIG